MHACWFGKLILFYLINHVFILYAVFSFSLSVDTVTFCKGFVK